MYPYLYLRYISKVSSPTLIKFESQTQAKTQAKMFSIESRPSVFVSGAFALSLIPTPPATATKTTFALFSRILRWWSVGCSPLPGGSADGDDGTGLCLSWSDWPKNAKREADLPSRKLPSYQHPICGRLLNFYFQQLSFVLIENNFFEKIFIATECEATLY